MKKLIRRLNLETLNELVDQLQQVDDLLPGAYYEVQYEEDEVSEVEEGHVESEEVEVTLSSAISTVSKLCGFKREPKTLSDLLQKFFPSDEVLISLAMNFEESINGYFGELFGESLQLANEYLSEIIKTLSEKRDKWTPRQGSTLF